MTDVIPAYSFCVRILNKKKGQTLRAQEVSGLSLRLNIEKLDGAAGENGTAYLPASISYEPLVIKRAYMESDPGMDLSKVQESVQKLQIQPVDLGIHLRDEKGKYIHSWNVMNAHLISWQINGFNVSQQGVFMEHLSFEYNNLRKV